MDDSREMTLEASLDTLLREPPEAAKERAATAFDKEAAPFQNRFVLFGSGNTGRRILARLREDGIEPLAFADNGRSRWGSTIDGLPVLSPAEAAARYGRTAAFIVTIYNRDHSFPDTRKQLLTLGCVKVISVIPVRWKYHETFLPHFRDDLPFNVLQDAESIREAHTLWADEASRREFIAQVVWRLTGDFDSLAAPYPDQYFPADLIQGIPDEFFVDVGAYNGDTVREFLKRRGHTFRKIVALEPDQRNFVELSECVRGLPADISRKIDVLAFAASNRACRLRFSDGSDTSSALSDTGSVEVDCVRLDDLLASSRPTFVKMDVEGAELDAIAGCTRILAEHAPASEEAWHREDRSE